MTVSSDSAAKRRSPSFATHVAPATLYVGAIFYGGLMRMAVLPEVGFVATDKLVHAGAFGVLALLLMRAARFGMPASSLPKHLLLGALGASVLGALLEICQAFVPYRSADVWDWVADTAGAALASGVLLAWSRLLPGPTDG